MRVALDIDGVINEYPAFFHLLSRTPGFEIYIITNREPGSERDVEVEMAHYGIHYDHLVLTHDKANFIIKNNIEVFFENTDEYFQHLPPTVCVCKIREPGNFDYNTGRWIYGPKTGENIIHGIRVRQTSEDEVIDLRERFRR